MKSFWKFWKVGRRYGRALKLERQGRLKEAYEVASDALVLLWDLPRNGYTPSLTTGVVITTFLDRIALKLGTPDVTAHALVKALDECRLAGLENPEPGELLKEYVDWIKYRIHQQANTIGDLSP